MFCTFTPALLTVNVWCSMWLFVTIPQFHAIQLSCSGILAVILRWIQLSLLLFFLHYHYHQNNNHHHYCYVFFCTQFHYIIIETLQKNRISFLKEVNKNGFCLLAPPHPHIIKFKIKKHFGSHYRPQRTVNLEIHNSEYLYCRSVHFVVYLSNTPTNAHIWSSII